jgi:hypothetical protein
MSRPALAATTCALPNRGRGESPLDLWTDIANTLCARQGSTYQQGRARFRLLLPNTSQTSPDGQFQHFRTINLHPRIKNGAPTLLDMEVGNWFCSPADTSVPLRSADISQTKWVRGVSSIPLDEHLQIARSAVDALKKAGWTVKRAQLEPLTLDAPRVVVRGSQHTYAPDRVGQLARQSLSACTPPSVGVMQLDGVAAGQLDGTQDLLASAWAALIRGNVRLNVRQVAAPIEGESFVTLVLIPDTVDLAERADLRASLASWEQQGCRFKLARVGTLQNRFSLQNICFDLAMIAGCDLWQPASCTIPAVAFDAGHDTDARRSRWASAFVDERLRVTSLKAVDTELAEHIPLHVTDRYWPGDPSAMVLRDGRLARERASFEKRAEADGRWLIEVKKHPGAILFRKESGRSIGAKFGDVVEDQHGEVLLQTLDQGSGDCHHPLCISLASSADRAAQVQALFDQTAVPGLTLFRQARLPGAIYWADLASKLDRTGWSQVIGRGWRLSSVVPDR